jgi:hypothetical protein
VSVSVITAANTYSDELWIRLFTGAFGVLLLVAAGYGIRDYMRRYRKR